MTRRHKLTKRSASLAAQYLLLLIGGAVSILPMVYMVSTPPQPNGALYEFPPRFLPTLEELTAENYQYIFTQEKFYLNFLNSVAVTLLTVVIAAFIATALAFCLARFRFPGRRLLFGLVIGTMIIALLQEGIMAMGFQKDYQYVITGIIVVISVCLDVRSKMRKN